MRRKLGDMTKKLENLELRYHNLREVGILEAEKNFERLRTQSEAKAKGTAPIPPISFRPFLVCAINID